MISSSMDKVTFMYTYYVHTKLVSKRLPSPKPPNPVHNLFLQSPQSLPTKPLHSPATMSSEGECITRSFFNGFLPGLEALHCGGIALLVGPLKPVRLPPV